jgi:5-methylcytosine-specific restriction endonuclease McrA
MAMSTRNKRNRKKWLIDQYGLICQLCTDPIASAEEATLDHIIPKSKGGVDARHNLQLAHRECNNKKSAGIITQPFWRKKVETEETRWRQAVTTDLIMLRDRIRLLEGFIFALTLGVIFLPLIAIRLFS